MQTPVDIHATPHARELLQYLADTAGRAIITGQHTQTVPMEEIDYIRRMTGREPMLRGFELLGYSPNINYADAGPDCLTEVRENQGTLDTALAWGRRREGIVTFTFHWFSPLGGRDKAFYAENTDFDARRVLMEGTPERAAFFQDMDAIAALLRPFLDEDIPVLWRPFHESDGAWFWWGAQGPAVAKELYKLMFRRYTQVHGLHNLLWVWNCRLAEGWPGEEYVDVVSLDEYLPAYAPTDYREQYETLVAATTRNKVAALAEIGYLPDLALLERSRVPWAYFMVWSKEFCIGESRNSTQALRQVYSSGYAVTL